MRGTTDSLMKRSSFWGVLFFLLVAAQANAAGSPDARMFIYKDWFTIPFALVVLSLGFIFGARDEEPPIKFAYGVLAVLSAHTLFGLNGGDGPLIPPLIMCAAVGYFYPPRWADTLGKRLLASVVIGAFLFGMTIFSLLMGLKGLTC